MNRPITSSPIEMVINTDQMRQISFIKDEVNRLKSNKRLSLGHYLDILEIFSTDLPPTDRICMIISSITNAHRVLLSKDYDAESQKGKLTIVNGIYIAKVSAVKERI